MKGHDPLRGKWEVSDLEQHVHQRIPTCGGRYLFPGGQPRNPHVTDTNRLILDYTALQVGE